VQTGEATVEKLQKEMDAKNDLIEKLKESAKTAEIVETVTASLENIKVIQTLLLFPPLSLLLQKRYLSFHFLFPVLSIDFHVCSFLLLFSFRLVFLTT
jgi:3-hydroxyacyl-CoA dehydrogenase